MAQVFEEKAKVGRSAALSDIEHVSVTSDANLCQTRTNEYTAVCERTTECISFLFSFLYAHTDFATSALGECFSVRAAGLGDFSTLSQPTTIKAELARFQSSQKQKIK